MELWAVHELWELARAIVRTGDTERVRALLEQLEAAELTLEEVVTQIQALNYPVH